MSVSVFVRRRNDGGESAFSRIWGYYIGWFSAKNENNKGWCCLAWSYDKMSGCTVTSQHVNCCVSLPTLLKSNSECWSRTKQISSVIIISSNNNLFTPKGSFKNIHDDLQCATHLFFFISTNSHFIPVIIIYLFAMLPLKIYSLWVKLIFSSAFFGMHLWPFFLILSSSSYFCLKKNHCSLFQSNIPHIYVSGMLYITTVRLEFQWFK